MKVRESMRIPWKKKHIYSVLLLIFVVHGIVNAQQLSQTPSAVSADVKKQIEKLQSGSPRQKINAARTLGKMGEKAAPAVHDLIELIDSQEKYESLLDKILNTVMILGSSGDYVMYESQQALVRIGRPAVEPLSTALLKHSRSRVRYNAAIVLGNIKDLDSVAPLITALRTDTDYEVRMWSAAALGNLADKWSIDALDNAVPALMEALKDNNSNVQQKAAYALGKMKAMAAVPALIEALRTYGRNSDAGLALFMITGQRFGDDPQKWQEWWKRNRPY
jgi:HEAT repeat protein